MNLSQLFSRLTINPKLIFFPKGRIGRETCLREQLVLLGLEVVLMAATFALAKLSAPAMLVTVLQYLIGATLIGLYASITTRRLHDLGRSGWGLLKWYSTVAVIFMAASYTPKLALEFEYLTRGQAIALLAVEGALGLVVLGHLVYTVFIKDGDKGDNRYGAPESGVAIALAPAA